MRTEPNLWDYHLCCEVPAQPKYYKVALAGGFIPDRESPVKPNDTIVAPNEVTGLWDGNSVMLYKHPALAICLQPIIEGFPAVEVWECEAEACMATIEGAVAAKSARLTKVMQLRLGQLNLIRFACACVSQVQPDQRFANWMLDWWDNQEGYFSSEEIARISWRVGGREALKGGFNERHKVYAPKAFIHYASHYLAGACIHYRQKDHKPEEIATRVAQAVMYAIYAADQMDRPLDTVGMIEKAFVAKAA